jgi:hypothetical protein
MKVDKKTQASKTTPTRTNPGPPPKLPKAPKWPIDELSTGAGKRLRDQLPKLFGVGVSKNQETPTELARRQGAAVAGTARVQQQGPRNPPWVQPPLSELGSASNGPAAKDIFSSADFKSRLASTVLNSGTANIGSLTGNAGAPTGRGQTVVQLGSEGTPQILGRYVAPGAKHVNAESIAAAVKLAQPNGTVAITMGFDADELLAAVRANPNITFIVPALSLATNRGGQTLNAADTQAFNRDLAAAGAIVVGTITPQGTQDAQFSDGQPMIRVHSYEHSGADSLVGSAVALMKEHNPNITNAEIAAALKAGSVGGSLNVEEALRFLGMR